MKIIKELNQNERDTLKSKHEHVDTFKTHIKPVIDKPRCFEVEIMATDYSKILIFAGGRKWHLLDEVALIVNNPSILKLPFLEYGLQGHMIENHIHAIKTYQGKPQEYFRQLRGCFMIDRGDGRKVYDVTDGQHRLVAYGLATGMDESKFPITVYWGTDQDDTKLKLIHK